MYEKVYVKLSRGSGKSIIKEMIDLLETKKIVFLPQNKELLKQMDALIKIRKVK